MRHLKKFRKRMAKDDKGKSWKNKKARKRFEKAVRLAERVNEFVEHDNWLVFLDGEVWNETFIISEFAINSIDTRRKESDCMSMWVGNGYAGDFGSKVVWTESMKLIKIMFKNFTFVELHNVVKLDIKHELDFLKLQKSVGRE